ncbi:hypothetical protein [Pseudomonas soli]|uniref:hypothetical protein n=1 Tax=Pseudomonas soli TaxID=1306993 RepID=UPI0038051B08
MSDVKVAKVKLYNSKLKAGFLDHEIDEDDVVLPRESVGSLDLKNGDKVSFKVQQKAGRHYAIDVQLKK